MFHCKLWPLGQQFFIVPRCFSKSWSAERDPPAQMRAERPKVATAKSGQMWASRWPSGTSGAVDRTSTTDLNVISMWSLNSDVCACLTSMHILHILQSQFCHFRTFPWRCVVPVLGSGDFSRQFHHFSADFLTHSTEVWSVELQKIGTGLGAMENGDKTYNL